MFTHQVQRLHARYVKAESFRKALVYQKKYLLLLLGGFQACENTTLAMIAKMGSYPSNPDFRRHSRAFTRFRTAARAIIAVKRMRYLMERQQRILRGEGSRAGSRSASRLDGRDSASPRFSAGPSSPPGAPHARRSLVDSYPPDSRTKDRPRSDPFVQNGVAGTRDGQQRRQFPGDSEQARGRVAVPITNGTTSRRDDKNRAARGGLPTTNRSRLADPTTGRYLPPMSPPVRDSTARGVANGERRPVHASSPPRYQPPAGVAPEPPGRDQNH